MQVACRMSVTYNYFLNREGAKKEGFNRLPYCVCQCLSIVGLVKNSI